jgi:crotonobetainyl-CoA:carnitine CoA-transferase CaiB-like acyl-CoA transferase
VVENFRVGGFAKLGFSDDELRELNPRLVHLAISGFGTRGPDAASRATTS